jgi:hypothetical protein
MEKKGRKQIWISSEVVEFLQQRMVPLSGISASDVLERALGIPRANEKQFEYFWVVRQHTSPAVAMSTQRQALEFAQGLRGAQIIPVRELRT